MQICLCWLVWVRFLLKCNDLLRRYCINKLILFAKIFEAMKVKRVSKIWLRISITNIHLLQFKFIVTSKKIDFDCWYIRNHTKEKLSKISNIAVAILFVCLFVFLICLFVLCVCVGVCVEGCWGVCVCVCVFLSLSLSKIF